MRQKNTAEAPQPGITIIGTFDQSASLSKVLRDLVRMLRRAGIPHQALNIPSEKPIPESEFVGLTTPREEFVTNRYSHVIAMRHNFNIPDKRCRNYAIEFWEFEDGVKEHQPEIVWLKNIIAMSDFNLNTFKRQLPNSNVKKILYPFQFAHGPLAPIESTRKKYGIPANTFTVFFNFDYRSSYYRKNPEGILHAFSKAFSATDNAVLVFKTMYANFCKSTSEQLHNIAAQLKLEKRLIIIDNFIPQEDIVNLTNACDVYMSLHRGEGFGLGIAEAMTLGKAVIVTDYSGTTEFCNRDNALLVPFSMTRVKPEQLDIEAYKHVSQWAEPDTDAAAEALKRLYRDPELRKRLGENGKHFIENYFSPENFKKSIEAFLKE